MIIEAIITAIIVSIDGFISGIALGIKKTKINIPHLLIISTIPIIMSFPIMLIGRQIKNIISFKTANYIGFTLFIILAISSYIQISKNKKNNNYNIINIPSSIFIGITIGIDSSISAFTLALNNHSPYITPFYFGITHGILISLGNKLSLKKQILNIEYYKYLSPILFTLIALSKL